MGLACSFQHHVSHHSFSWASADTNWPKVEGLVAPEAQVHNLQNQCRGPLVDIGLHNGRCIEADPIVGGSCSGPGAAARDYDVDAQAPRNRCKVRRFCWGRALLSNEHFCGALRCALMAVGVVVHSRAGPMWPLLARLKLKLQFESCFTIF
jgi:hypothetical protein